MSTKLEGYTQRIEELKNRVKTSTEIAKKKIPFENKRIDNIIRDQVDLDYEWQELIAEAMELCDELDQITSEKLSKAYKNLMDGDRAYSPSESKLLAASDDKYIESMKVYNKAKAVRQKITGTYSTIDNRRWVIKDLSAVIIDGSEHRIIEDE